MRAFCATALLVLGVVHIQPIVAQFPLDPNDFGDDGIFGDKDGNRFGDDGAVTRDRDDADMRSHDDADDRADRRDRAVGTMDLRREEPRLRDLDEMDRILRDEARLEHPNFRKMGKMGDFGRFDGRRDRRIRALNPFLPFDPKDFGDEDRFDDRDDEADDESSSQDDSDGHLDRRQRSSNSYDGSFRNHHHRRPFEHRKFHFDCMFHMFRNCSDWCDKLETTHMELMRNHTIGHHACTDGPLVCREQDLHMVRCRTDDPPAECQQEVRDYLNGVDCKGM